MDMKKQSMNQVSKFQIINIIYGGFSCGSAGKESACDVGDVSSIPGLGISPIQREGNGYALQYSGLENSIDCIDHEVAKSWTRLSDFLTNVIGYIPRTYKN